MERKTMGAFLAALRKANGMTQKDLAEKLNVSDKSVSRWERDDGAPDLSLIPVIAEVFGVTCDELLRGERRSAAGRTQTVDEAASSTRTEKQRQRLLAVSLSRYKTRSFIAIGLSIAGLIAAVVGNFGFNRAYIGFFIGAVFYLAAVVCQAIFVNQAFLSVADDELAGAEIDRFKCSVVRLAEASVGLTVVLLAFSLPLVIFPWDAYMGLEAGTWFLSAMMGAIALAICLVACHFLNATLLKKGIYPLSEQEQRVWRHNRRLKRKCAAVLAAALVATGAAHTAAANVWSAYALSEKLVFEDLDSFAAYMAQDLPYAGGGYANAPPSQVVEAPAYDDESGGAFSEEEALRDALTDREGNVLFTYIRRNGNVASIRHGGGEEDLLPIQVVTRDALRIGEVKQSIINAAFAAAYFAETVAAFLIYFKKRAK